MKRTVLLFILVVFCLVGCARVDVNAPAPVVETSVDPNAWVQIPAGEFLSGQESIPTNIEQPYEIMVTDVTNAQYAAFLNEALVQGAVKLEGEKIVGFYPGDVYHGARHEMKIESGDYLYIPLNDPSLRLSYDAQAFGAKPGWEDHPMTMVSWFGARGYCNDYGWRLPSELEWEKAARGTDGRPFPWGDTIARNRANFYSSRDPFEDMLSVGSRTSSVGFYNGLTYNGYATLDNASPYGVYDMAGNVWQWTANVYEGQHYRYMRGGSKDTYDYNLRVWTRNNATPTYVSPGVGFRCVR